MTRYDEITQTCHTAQLGIFGGLHDLGDTILLLGPLEPGFWAYVQASPEFADTAPNPLDRWSKRVIGQIAQNLNAQAIFPSDGPPYPPFIDWALKSGRAWHAPVGLLVHDTAGLMLSFRGALRLKGETLSLPPAPENTCISCAGQPCRTACPVNALTADNYDVPSCIAHIKSSDSAACKTSGCAARRICPVSQTYAREAEQSAFHMRAFLGE